MTTPSRRVERWLAAIECVVHDVDALAPEEREWFEYGAAMACRRLAPLAGLEVRNTKLPNAMQKLREHPKMVTIAAEIGAGVWVPLAALHSVACSVDPSEAPRQWRGRPWNVPDIAAAFRAWLAGEEPALQPIDVCVRDTDLMTISQGSHRLAAAREIGLPFIKVRWLLPSTELALR